MSIGLKRKRPSTAAEDPATSTATPAKVPRTSLEAGRDITAPAVPGRPGEMGPQLERIRSCGRSAFEKSVWALLCQIPPGHVSTYGLMSAHLGSSPRAVGNALRRNPFAPQVPCHRVVATGGALGGFKGHWSTNGEGITIDEKKRLLRMEGVKIDPKGRVLGTPWAAFV